MKKLYVFLAVLIFCGACSSGKKAYESGNYYQAVLQAVERLRQNPDHDKSQETLRVSYPLAVQTLEQDARNNLASNAPFKYRQVLRIYQTINNMNDQIRRSPGALAVIPNPVDYFSKIPEMKERAAEETYAAGLDALSRNTRIDAKNAYLLFRDTQEFIPGYKDVINKLDEALFKATLKVVVDQIPVPSLYNISAEFFQDKVEEYLHSQYQANPFVRFYTAHEAESENLPYVDQYLRIAFDDFAVGETHTIQQVETFSRDSVVVGEVTLQDGKKAKVYNTVTAKVTSWKKQVISRGLVRMEVFDANSKAVLAHNKFPGEFIWFSQWGNFNGDERALTKEQLQMCQMHEVPPPPPQTLFVEFTRPIYNQLIPTIDNFYRQY
jgi:hypothetical protein